MRTSRKIPSRRKIKKNVKLKCQKTKHAKFAIQFLKVKKNALVVDPGNEQTH